MGFTLGESFANLVSPLCNGSEGDAPWTAATGQEDSTDCKHVKPPHAVSLGTCPPRRRFHGASWSCGFRASMTIASASVSWALANRQSSRNMNIVTPITNICSMVLYFLCLSWLARNRPQAPRGAVD